MAQKPRKQDSAAPATNDCMAHDSDKTTREKESNPPAGTATDSALPAADVAVTAGEAESPAAGEIHPAVIDPARLAASTAVGVGYDEVLACRDYGTHYVVVTTSGQKLRGDK